MLIATLALAAAFVAGPSTRPAVTWTGVGEPTVLPNDLVGEPVTVAKVLADPKAFADQEIALKGKIDEICKTAGCWVRLRDPAAETGTPTIFVKFTCPREGRLVEMEARNRQVVARGTVVVEEIDEATARHYAEDAGKPAEEIAAIQGPQTIVRFNTPGIMIAEPVGDVAAE